MAKEQQAFVATIKNPSQPAIKPFSKFAVGDFLVAPRTNLVGIKVGDRHIRFSHGGVCDMVSLDKVYYPVRRITVEVEL